MNELLGTCLADVRLIVEADCHTDVGRSPQRPMGTAAFLSTNSVLSSEPFPVIYVIVHTLVCAIITCACRCLRQYPFSQCPAVLLWVSKTDLLATWSAWTII